MGRAEFGTPKWISNKLKSKGLQKLRWYCQMCQKQCRDENGFKCHTLSESHQRQMLIFSESPGKFLGNFSHEFEVSFLSLLKRAHNTKRVFANQVYQEYIRDKSHIHMNATHWTSLSGFVRYLGRTGKCVVEETEKGWYITWIDRDPETIARQEALKRKEKMSKDDSERMAEFIDSQVRRGKKDQTEEPEAQYSELVRDQGDSKIKLHNLIKKESSPAAAVATLRAPEAVFGSSSGHPRKECPSSTKRKKSAASCDQSKKQRVANGTPVQKPETAWLRPGIVVKIITRSLGDKYHKQKGYVKQLLDDGYAAIVVLLATPGCKLKLDQAHLETVIPGLDRAVVVLHGPDRGEEGVLIDVDVRRFRATVRLTSGPRIGQQLVLAYEHFCKLYQPP